MQFTKKPKPFSESFIEFAKSTSSFWHFVSTDETHSWGNREFINSDGYLNIKKVLFQTSLIQTTCERVPNPAETSTSALLSYSFMILRSLDLDSRIAIKFYKIFLVF